MDMTPSMHRFIADFGALGRRWGIEADTGRAHALLYLAGKPLPLPEIAKALDLSKTRACDALANLAQWGMARPIPDDRWDASGEPWDLLIAALGARRRRALPPALAMRRACRDAADIAAIDVHARRVPPKSPHPLGRAGRPRRESAEPSVSPEPVSRILAAEAGPTRSVGG
jgi:hypothetical protein